MDIFICPLPVAPPAPAPHGPEVCLLGSTTVLIDYLQACRQMDILVGAGPPNPFVMGCPTVMIGDIGFGMASAVTMAAYAAAMSTVFARWETLTPEQRLAAMEDAINAALPPGMPRLSLNPTSFADPNTNGQLSFRNWRIDVNRDLINGPMTAERFRNLTNTIYHEGRHGEQWYDVAQYRAGQGQSAEQISRETGMPQRVGEAAVSDPAARGTAQGAMGENVNRSVYGDRRHYRNGVLGDASGSAASYQQYRALPEEQDAWRAGDAAGGLFPTGP
ncbi:MAG: hypothetical protein WCT12_35350 [Verrucomicrobiota bacterium]